MSASLPGLAARWLEYLMLKPPRHPPRDDEQHWLARAHQQWLSMEGLPLAHWNGKRFRLLRWGTPRRGRIYLLHGWGGRASQFLALLPRLLAAGFEVVGVEAPAHGESEGRGASLLHFAAALRRAVDACGPGEAVIAHSFGGAAVVHALRQGVALRSAVLIAAPLDLGNYSRAFAHATGFSETVRARMQAGFEQRVGIHWSSLAVLPVAAQLQQPGLILHDEEDREVPFACAPQLAEAWRGSVLRVSRGLGHRRILQDPVLADEVLCFLEGEAVGGGRPGSARAADLGQEGGRAEDARAGLRGAPGRRYA